LNWDKARAALGAEGSLSIILPCYRLETVIAENLRRVAATFRGKLPFSIIAVDDGSGDQTSEQLHSIQSDIPEMEIVELKDNQGKGHALREGFKAARGSHIMFLDADLDLPPYQACWFLEEMADSGADIVIGAKRHPRSELVYPMKRRIISATYYMIVRLLFGLPVRDTQTGIKLFRRAALETVLPRMLVKRFAFDLELLGIAHALGFRIAEAPVTLSFHGLCHRPNRQRDFQRHAGRILSSAHSALLSVPASDPGARIHAPGQRRHCLPRPEPLSRRVPARSGRPAIQEFRGADSARSAERQNVARLGARNRHRPPTTGRETQPGDSRGTRDRCRLYRRRRHAGGGVARRSREIPGRPRHRRRRRPGRDPAQRSLPGPIGRPGIRQSDRVGTQSLPLHAHPGTRIGRLAELQSAGPQENARGEDTVLCLEIVKRGETILYNPHVLVYHHRRKLFAPHLRQVGRYALHRGFFVRRFPQTSFRLPYMMPSALLLGILAGAALAGLYPPLRVWYVVGVLAYLLLTGAAAFPLEALLVSMRLPLRAWILTWLGVMATHGVYGFRFLCGLLARRMPENIDSFDHVSESRP